MRQLLLLRHAKAASDDGTLSDRDRPLTPSGRQAAILMREAMRVRGLEPDLVLVSSARRTLQTLQALEPWDDTPLIEPLDPLYLAPAPQLLAILHTVPETVRAVLLIAHNPGLHDLALALAAPPANHAAREAARTLARGFPTAALAVFSIATPWASLAPRNAHLLHTVTPQGLQAKE